MFFIGNSKHPISEVLKQGINQATSKKALMNLFDVTERELLAQIMRERLDGEPILSKKKDGGGFFLPETREEIDGYLKLLKRSIKTQISVYEAIKENLKTKNSITQAET